MATNKFGQSLARFRINVHESTNFCQVLSDLDYSKENEPLDKQECNFEISSLVYNGRYTKIGLTSQKDLAILYDNGYNDIIPSFVHVNIPTVLSACSEGLLYLPSNCEQSLIQVLAAEEVVSEQALSIIVGQVCLFRHYILQDIAFLRSFPAE